MEWSESFRQLVALQTWGLYQTQLTELSESFGQLVNLQTLPL